MKTYALCLVCIVVLTCSSSINSFTLPKEGETHLKRCVPAGDGTCIVTRNPPHCDHPNCINGGGCVGWKGACAGICYCYGVEYKVHIWSGISQSKTSCTCHFPHRQYHCWPVRVTTNAANRQQVCVSKRQQCDLNNQEVTDTYLKFNFVEKQTRFIHKQGLNDKPVNMCNGKCYEQRARACSALKAYVFTCWL